MVKRIQSFLVFLLTLIILLAGCNKKKVQWNVEFDFNGGYGLINEEKVEGVYKTTINDGDFLDFPNAYKEGHDFLGWYKGEEEISSHIKITENIKLIAKWSNVTPQEFTITYELNGGIFVSDVVGTYKYGDNFDLPIPQKSGYVFDGWFENDDFSGEKREKIKATDNYNIKVYAKFVEESSNPKIMYELNGGYFLEEPKYEYIIGETYQLLEPERDEYIFDGWFESSDFSTPQIKEIKASDNHSFVLYARCEDMYVRKSITFSLEGGRFEGEFPETYPEGKGCSLPVPIRKGYEFVGWYDTDLKRNIVSLDSHSYGNKILIAVWEKIYVYSEIDYQLDGRYLDNDAISIYPEGAWTELPIPQKKGYFFRGYYYESDFSGKEITMIDDSKKGKLTIYAKWVEAKLENAYISFYGDSITTYSGMIPEGYASYYPLLDVRSVADTWWHQMLTQTKANLLVNNSYGGTAVYGGTNQGMDEKRMALLTTKEISSPDVIIVYLGINDVVNKRSIAIFEEGYQEMIHSMKKMYPRAQIFLCTLGYETYTNQDSPGLRNAFSNIITKIANMNNCEIIDFASVITEKNGGKVLGDRIHPNQARIDLLASKASQVLTSYYQENKNYEIKYNLDGGVFSKSPITIYSNLNVNLILEKPSKLGYKFLGWYDNEGKEVLEIKVGSKQDYNLIARWEKIIASSNQLQVIFIDYLGNQIVKKVNYGDYLDKEKIDNSINGDIEYVWMIDTELFDFSTPITDNLVITETWKSVYEVISSTFSPNVFDDLILQREYKTSMGKISVIWQSSDKYTINETTGRVNPAREDKEVYLTARFSKGENNINYSFKVIVHKIEFKSLEGEKPVFAYVYTNTKNLAINELTTQTIDVAHYGFARAVSNGNVIVGELSNMDDVLKLRKYGIRVLLCIGGYETAGIPFSDVAFSASLREKFAKSIVETIEKYHFDGVDIDWEYPGFGTGRDVSIDRPNYTLLMAEIRRQVKAKNNDYIVSAALPGGIFTYKNYELNQLNNILDYVHLMTYDLQSSSKTSHHTALYDNPNSPFGTVEQTVKTYESQGIAKNKLIVGIAFYGRMFTLSGEVTNSIGNTNVISGGKTITYADIYKQYLSKAYSSNSDITIYFDEKAYAPYIYDSKNKIFITYDDPLSVAGKCQYVKENDLGGVMFWDYGEDLTFTLLNAIYQEMK